MNYQELTPMRLSGYDGNMEPTVPEQPKQPEPIAPEVAPAPVSPAAKSLIENANNDAEIGEAPKEARQLTPESMAKDAMDKTSKSPTRERLVEISRDVIRQTDPGKIASDARLVAGWARLIKNGLPKEEFEKFRPLFEQAERTASVFSDVKDQARGENYKNKAGVATGNEVALAQRTAIADIAQKMKEYFEKERLVERVDYFKPITSFEEFMVKIADFSTKDEFRPGGKHQLLEIQEDYDEFGRKIVIEKAHPENFIHWTRDQLEFFHDFSPTTNINLFQDIAIPTAGRQISLGEILYGATSDTYFSHRVPKIDAIIMSEEDMLEIVSKDRETFTFVRPDRDGNGGKYIVKQKDGTKKTYTLKRAARLSADGTYAIGGYNLVDEKGEVAHGVDLEKDSWNTEKNAGYDKAKNDVLWEAFLLNNFHNYSVLYRIQAMQSEEPLKEKMAEVFGLNMMTDSRERLLRLFRMQSVDKQSETALRLEKDAVDDGVTQGSVGKAMQRSIAGYYHLSEANASETQFEKDANGKILNAFVEVLKRKKTPEQEGVAGSEEFYKSLINQALENDFSKEIAGIKALVDRLNQEKINGKIDEKEKKFSDDFSGEALRDREDWEKVQVSEVAFLDRKQLLDTLRDKYRIASDQFDDVLRKLEQDLEHGYTDTQGKDHSAELGQLEQLKTIGDREKVLRLLIGKNKVKEDLFKPAGYMRLFIDAVEKGEWEGLGSFAIQFHAQPFAGGSQGGFTDNANIWSNISYDHRALKRVRQAMRHAISHTERLSDFEALYAEEWAYVLVYQTGIAARNDMNGIGHDAWSKIQNTEYYRLRQSGGGNYPGNLDNLYGVHRLGVNVWEGLKVQRENGKLDTTLYEVLTGLKEEKDANGNTILQFDVNKDVGTFDFYGNAERQFYADHLSHAIDLFIDVTKKHEFNINNLINEDGRGRYVINHAEMQKLIDSTWKHLRYAFDNRSFLYDKNLYGWWYDEKIELEEYDKEGKRLSPEKIKLGQVKRTPRFGFKTLRDLMFSHEVQMMDMYERPDVSGWKPGSKANKMGRNVFAYFISKQMEEHTKNSGTATMYNADQVAIIADAFMAIAARVMKGEHGEAVVLSGFFNAEETIRILVYANALLWKLYGKEYGFDAFGGIFSAILQMVSVIMKETGAGITLKS